MKQKSWMDTRATSAKMRAGGLETKFKENTDHQCKPFSGVRGMGKRTEHGGVVGVLE